MNSFVLPAARRSFASCLAGLSLFLIAPQIWAADPPPVATPEYQPAPEEFSALGKAVVELLRSGDAARFATNVVGTTDDLKSVISTNLPIQVGDILDALQRATEFERQKVEASARVVLETAASLHLDFTNANWRPRVIIPTNIGRMHFVNLQAENEFLPFAERLEIIVDSGAAGGSTNGNFKLALRSLTRYAAGWRSHDGIQWETVPNNVGDEKTRSELAVWSKVSANQSVTGQDDPSLSRLGDALVRFIRGRDPAVFEKDADVHADLFWAEMQKSGSAGPSRNELDQEFVIHVKQQTDLARATIKLMEDADVDLKNADIRIEEVSVEIAKSPHTSGPLDGLMGHKFMLKLAVKSKGRSKNGTPLSGEYILAADDLLRFESDWKISSNVHWYQMPDGVLDREVADQLNLENYVAEHYALPPKAVAPDIEFITLNGEKKMKLSDLKGRVVVLDFWATWCPPCQAPMANLQNLLVNHPDWKDRVTIVPLSIDDALDIVQNHVDRRGWTNTFNVWAEDGGIHSKPATAFRVAAVPTTYIIDPAGKIVAGQVGGLPVENILTELLKK